MERIIKFKPAYDKRHTDPSKNYGIHGVDLLFVVKGEEGAVQLLVFTNWFLPKVQKELEGKNCRLSPMPADLGYHSRKPLYDSHEPIGDCEWLDGEECYYDGSTLNAKRVFDILVEKGDEAVWKYLEGYYEDIFREDN